MRQQRNSWVLALVIGLMVGWWGSEDRHEDAEHRLASLEQRCEDSGLMANVGNDIADEVGNNLSAEIERNVHDNIGDDVDREVTQQIEESSREAAEQEREAERMADLDAPN